MAIIDSINKIKELYNGDFDYIQGDPIVSWTDRELVNISEELFNNIENLEAKLERFNSQTDSISGEKGSLLAPYKVTTKGKKFIEDIYT